MITAKEAREILPPNSKLVSEIEGFEHVTRYAIDTSGTVWSFNSGNEWIALKERLDSKGYVCVQAMKNKIRIGYRVHRLMAMLYLSNPENKECVNHKNGIRNDNRIENLEWCTRSENIKHAYDVLNHPILRGMKNPKAKLNDDKVREIRKLLNDGLSLRGIAKIYDTHSSIILGIKQNKRWAHVTELACNDDDNSSLQREL